MLPLVYTLRSEGINTEYDHALANEAIRDFLSTVQGNEGAYQSGLADLAASLYSQACLAAGKTYFLDKTPRYYYIVRELSQFFPLARFIILFRHPLAVLNSILETRVKGDWILLGRYRGDLLDAPPRLLEAAAFQHVAVFPIRYEELVNHPDRSVPALFDFLGLDYSPHFLEYRAAARPDGSLGDKTIDQYERPTSERLNRWHRLGENAQTLHFALEYLNTLGEDTVTRLGYSADEARNVLRSLQSRDHPIELNWAGLMTEQSPLRSRMFYAELALLEHRRFIMAIRNFAAKLGLK